MFLRLILLGIGLVSSYLGSLCFQTGSGADMAVGAGALLIGILCFFFLAKGLWRFLGCLSTFILIAVIVGVLFFFVSGSDMIGGLTEKVLNSSKEAMSTVSSKVSAGEDTPANEQDTSLPVQAAPTATGAEAFGMPPAATPQAMPIPQTVKGNIASIVSGDVFRIPPHTIRLYGIATPLMGQQCLDAKGHSFDCGYNAAMNLKKFVSGDEVSCRIMNINAQNELMAACSVGTFDIGAALVEEGWAIALPAVTQIYLPYQNKARQAKKGLWAGQFVTPWEWQAQQQQEKKENIKIKLPPSPSSQKKSIFNVF